jgi:hypothetical protein
MIIALRRLTTAGALLSLAAFAAVACAQSDTQPDASSVPLTPLQKQLARIDFGISGMGDFTKNTTGPNDLNGLALTDAPGSTLGALVTIRYTKSPYIGFEFNYTYSRFVQNYSGTNIGPPPAGSTANSNTPYVLGVQTTTSEFSGGYVAHTPKILGIGTFVALGAGSTEFRPTRGGGQSFLPQARATYYYNVGAETQVVNPHFGVRLSFRQAFYLAPDFQTNYLRNHQRTFTTEPNFGFFIHF